MKAKIVIALLAALNLSGCASTGGEVLSIPDSTTETITITWARVTADQISFYCHKSRGHPGAMVLACAEPLGQTCTIYTTKQASLELIGHEVAHCYLGAWHN